MGPVGAAGAIVIKIGQTHPGQQIGPVRGQRQRRASAAPSAANAGGDDLTQLQEIVSREPEPGLALDLRDLRLIDADGIRFLIRCEARGIRVENCPAYMREWMSEEKR